MDLFSAIGGFANSAGGYILPFLFVLVIVVFIHELGHFLVGRWCGIKVVAFSIGFGPEIVGWTDSKGTRWRLAAIPLGGYVKFFGDNSAASTPDGDSLSAMSEAEKAVSFHYQPVWKRALTVAAGSIGQFHPGDRHLRRHQCRLRQAGAGAADRGRGGRQRGRAGRAEGRRPDRQHRWPAHRQLHGHAAYRLHLAGPVAGSCRGARGAGRRRQGRARAQGDQDAARHASASACWACRLRAIPPTSGRSNSASAPRFRTPSPRPGSSSSVPASYVGGLFAGTETTDQLSGPIRIAQVSGQVATAGIVALLNLAAILSVSIGLINLVPVPLLDGGHLLFYAFEAVRGRPLSERTQEFGFRIGLALVVMLMIFTTFNDLVHLVAS